MNPFELDIIKAETEYYKHLAYTDRLTQLPNRIAFEESLNSAWSKSLKYGVSIAILLLDVDYFKKLNDTYGHEAGDLALVHLSQAWDSFYFRSTDRVSRIGGEEFGLVLSSVSLDSVIGIANRFLCLTREVEIQLADIKLTNLTVSIGGSIVVADRDLTSKRLVNRADEALYLAKKNGRNQMTIK